jgi:hypothetical protein
MAYQHFMFVCKFHHLIKEIKVGHGGGGIIGIVEKY